MPDEQLAEKVKDFTNEVIAFGRGDHSRFSNAEEIANQAIVILSIEQLNIQNNTLISIKHLLNDDQIKDVDKIIEKNIGIKEKLYNNVLPM